jgi:hypothetical protein
MAHKRKDTRVASTEWWQHLRPFNKRLQSKAERRAAKDEIIDEMEPDESPKGLGLRNSPKKMAKLRATKGELVVAKGGYCYDERGKCPYWDKAANKPSQCNGYCWLLCKGDWDDGIGELWDQCKNCGLRPDDAPPGTLVVYDE